MTISVASLPSQSAGILNVLMTYVSGALLLWALRCSLLITALKKDDLRRRKKF